VPVHFRQHSLELRVEEPAFTGHGSESVNGAPGSVNGIAARPHR